MAATFHSVSRLGTLAWLLAGAAVLAALAWLERDNLSTLPGQLISIDWRWAAIALLLLASVDLAKALRWQALYGRSRPSFRRVLQALILGQAANTLIPLRLGDAVRVGWAAPTPGGVARGTAGLVLSKAIDAVVLVSLIAWVFGASLVTQVQLLPLIALGLLVAIVLGVAQRARLAGWQHGSSVPALLAGIGRYARELRPSSVGIVLLTSAFAWIVGGIANLAVLAAVGGPPTVDFGARILGSAYVAGLLPAPPGRWGVFEGTVAAALVAGGMDLPLAIAAAVVLHILQLIEIGLLVLAATRWR